MIIRAETAGDLAAVFALHAAAFPTDAEARLVDLLRTAGDLSLSLVAELDGTLAGHVAFSPLDAPFGVGLAPVAVAAASRRRGIADALIREGLSRCRTSGARFCVVLGEPAYYRRFGFAPASRFGLRDEYGGGEAFQVLALAPDGIPAGRGLIRYAGAFASLG